MQKKVRIATRKSELALWQANKVATLLHKLGIKTKLIEITTKGDINLDTSLDKLGGKGVFIKELEKALLEEEADIAVHSMKDVPNLILDSFSFPCYLKRDNPADCLIIHKENSKKWESFFAQLKCEKKIKPSFFKQIPSDFKIATSSLRRTASLLQFNNQLNILPIRGNLNTRLNKLASGFCDGLILARSGVDRLTLDKNSTEVFQNFSNHFYMINLSQELMLPAIAQGVIGIQCRSNDENLIKTLQKIDDSKSRICLDIERLINLRLDGGCLSTLAVYSKVKKDKILIKARVLKSDGSECIFHKCLTNKANAMIDAEKMAQHLINLGAKKYLS